MAEPVVNDLMKARDAADTWPTMFEGDAPKEAGDLVHSLVTEIETLRSRADTAELQLAEEREGAPGTLKALPAMLQAEQNAHAETKKLVDVANTLLATEKIAHAETKEELAALKETAH